MPIIVCLTCENSCVQQHVNNDVRYIGKMCNTLVRCAIHW